MKALIFDSSPIITLALNDLLRILEPLKDSFNGEFFITEPVKYELFDKSIETKRFKLEALMIQDLIDKGIFKVKKDKMLFDEMQKIMNIANNTFKTESAGIKIIHDGEASCLALYKLLPFEDKAIVVDERTTRMLCENPVNFHKLLEKKHHVSIKANEVNYDFFRKFRIIRSSELVYIAFKKKIISFNFPNREVLDALLFALKFKGCSISYNEINAIKKML